MKVQIDTTGWRPWLYFLTVVLSVSGDETADIAEYTLPNAASPTFDALDRRHVCLRIAAQTDHLDVQVADSWRIADGTHARRMLRTSAGLILHDDLLSEDDGRTWTQRSVGRSSGWCELRDGTVIAVGSKPEPVAERKGWYEAELLVSGDGGRSAPAVPTLFHVPLAKPAMGHAPHKGPLYMASIVERADGTLVVLMAGWFEGDDEICPYGNGRPYSRTYVCESRDRGRHWEYLATTGYDRIGSEGYNEGTLRRLPDGDLIVVMRTGSMISEITQDNPIMLSRSSDGGRTWEPPWRTGANGAYPHLLRLSDGMLAVSSGRPGAFIMFSRDEGRTWTDRTPIDATPYSGYTSIVELSPGLLLVAYGAKQWIDPRTGLRSNQVRVARVTYRSA